MTTFRRSHLAAILLTVLLVSTCLSGPVSAESRQGWVLLKADQYQAWELSSAIPAALTVNISVTEGGAVDIIFLTASEYARYRDNLSFIADPLSIFNVTEYVIADYLINPGDFYLVVDNTNRTATTEGARAQGETNISFLIGLSMEVHLGSTSISLWTYVFLIGAVVILAIVLFMTFKVLRNVRRKRR